MQRITVWLAQDFLISQPATEAMSNVLIGSSYVNGLSCVI